MSFSIVPCNLASWYKQHGNPNQVVTNMLREYESHLAGIPQVDSLKAEIDGLVGTGTPVTVDTLLGDPSLTQILDIVLTNLYYGQFVNESVQTVNKSDLYAQLAADPMHALLNGLIQDPTYQVIPVAAAGNGVWLPDGTQHQLPFPTAPGIWNSVVSTSSADPDPAQPNATPTTPAAYSNSGEVMMSADNPYSGIGTSFSAPHLSALEALYLLNGGTVSCDSNVPPLGYADSDSGVNTWNNLWLGFGTAASGAVPTTGPALGKCGTFQSLAQ